jgi:hypothetical protein
MREEVWPPSRQASIDPRCLQTAQAKLPDSALPSTLVLFHGGIYKIKFKSNKWHPYIM